MLYSTPVHKHLLIAFLKNNLIITSQFLGHKFEIHDELYMENRACVRYTSHKGEHLMEVCEWFYKGKNYIEKIVSYYNVGNVSYEKDLNQPNL